MADGSPSRGTYLVSRANLAQVESPPQVSRVNFTFASIGGLGVAIDILVKG